METFRKVAPPLDNNLTIIQSDLQGDRSSVIDYGQYLRDRNINYTTDSPYLIVSTNENANDWLIYLTVVKQDFERLIHELLPFLAEQKCSFTIPENSDIHTHLLDGSYGENFIGKVVSVYCDPVNDIDQIVKSLIDMTAQLSGPAISAAYPISGCVYLQRSVQAETSDTWPLITFKKPELKKDRKKIKKFLLMDLLKADAKGNVYKALDLNKWLAIRWCVIKEGKFGHCSDDFGRTVKDRLKWQYEILTRLSPNIPVSKPLGYFEFDGDSYLVIEFIKGKILYQPITEIQQGVIWFALEKDAKRKLLKLILELIKLIELFHAQGIIHRDINPGNFILTDDGHLFAIDIELAYDSLSKEPDPPFTFGTPGYVSPQQQSLKQPTFSDDIFSLGALIIKIMTGISPGKFENKDTLYPQLNWFIQNNAMSTMITGCLDNDSNARPSLKSIFHTIEVYDVLVLTDHIKNFDDAPRKSDHRIKQTIQWGLNAFLHIMPQNQTGIWIFRGVPNGNVIANEFRAFQSIAGLANGSAGVLYVIALCEKCQFETVNLHQQVLQNFETIKYAFREKNPYPGLLKGATGFAVAINELILSGLIESSLQYHDLLYQCLMDSTFEFNVAEGMAGRGMALLQCSSNIRLTSFYNELSCIVDQLVKAQETDGSWLIKKDESRSKGIKLYGFVYGIAGIVYFLIEYVARFEGDQVRAAVDKALAFLLKGRKLNNGKLCWTVSAINDSFDPWFEYGFSGIALTFIKAYETLGEEKYKYAAESALYCHPQFISSNYMTLGNGLAGLGEVYLEAYRAFQNREWLERADHIANLLLHTYRKADDQSIYWLDGNSSFPEGGLMGGNIGIIHFLLHYLKPQKINFPFNFN